MTNPAGDISHAGDKPQRESPGLLPGSDLGNHLKIKKAAAKPRGFEIFLWFYGKKNRAGDGARPGINGAAFPGGWKSELLERRSAGSSP